VGECLAQLCARADDAEDSGGGGCHAGRLREIERREIGSQAEVGTMPAMATEPAASDTRVRCAWPGTDPLNLEHHDVEWGVPSHDRRHLFELLSLEAAQAGLSWTTILRKRAGYHAAFVGFEPEAVAKFTPDDVDRLLLDAGIIRNRAKIEATIDNARAILALESAGTGFVEHLWSFVGGAPIERTSSAEAPAETAESKAMSKDLKRRGFRFVGPTVLYAFMQSAGLVNDHELDCYRHAEVAALA
jgi:DNA-3-methyladenine glycosylase I